MEEIEIVKKHLDNKTIELNKLNAEHRTIVDKMRELNKQNSILIEKMNVCEFEKNKLSEKLKKLKYIDYKQFDAMFL